MRANARRGARWLAGVWAVAVLAAVVTAGPAQAAPAPAPFTYSTVAWTGSSVIVAAVNTAGDLYYYWQPDGTATWNRELVAAGQYKYSVPSIAWTGSTVIIADSGDGSHVDYYYQPAGTQTWHAQPVPGTAGVTYFGPATISWTGSAVIIAAVAVSGYGSFAPTALDYWYQPAGTGTWYLQQVATGVGYTNYAGPSIGWTGSTVVITAADTSGNLDYWYQYADTGTWHPQQVAAASAAGGQFNQWASPVISWTGSSVVIAAIDSDGDLYYWYQPVGTGTWHQQEVAAGSVAYYSTPRIAWTGSSVVLAGVARNGNLNFWWQAAGTGTWHPENVATLTPGQEYYNPSMAVAGGSVVITDSDSSDPTPGLSGGPGGNLDYWWQQDGTAGWNPQQIAAG